MSENPTSLAALRKSANPTSLAARYPDNAVTLGGHQHAEQRQSIVLPLPGPRTC